MRNINKKEKSKNTKNPKNLGRKLVSIFLAVLIVLSVIPLSAFGSDEAYAYVSDISAPTVLDGTGPWDITDTAGNDSSNSNRIVRSFDTVSYNFNVSMSSLSEIENYTDGTLCVKIEMYNDITHAEFDMEQMKWCTDYTIRYYDADSNLLAEGTNGKPDYSANEHANGSDCGSQSYRTPVVRQVFIGKYNLNKNNGTVVIPGTQELSLGIKTLAAPNGTEIKPNFTFWVDGNENNIGRDGNKVENKYEPEIITVSAKGRYNVAVGTRNESYKNIFDFATGDKTLAESETTATGKTMTQGWGLQLYNETDNPNMNIADKGLKGCELPVGKITFDITFTEKDLNNKVITDDGWTPFLWDYRENNSASKIGNLGRNMFYRKNGDWSVSHYASQVFPGSKRLNDDPTSSEYLNFCYDSGAATVEGNGFDINSYTAKDFSNGVSSVKFTVSNYDFDLDTFFFPSKTIDLVTDVANWKTFVGNFASGSFMSIIQFPFNYTESNQIYYYVNADNLSATSVSGETSGDISESDNSRGRSITLYTKGSVSKANYFGSPSTRAPWNTSDGCIYTNHYDATAYAGDELSIFGRITFGSNNDDNMTSVDILQKFDSTVFTINESEKYPLMALKGSNLYTDLTKECSVNFLYAADPLYPNGYDSNNAEEAKRMSKTSESDMIYFKTLSELENAGYTCCGVLLEIRNHSGINSSGMMLKIPVKLSPDADVNKTYAITNVAYAWSEEQAGMSSVTYANGSGNNIGVGEADESFVNTLEGRETPFWTVENTTQYVKAEFNKDGTLVAGTANGSVDLGNTLNVLNFDASVKISPDKTSYDYIAGQRTIEYTLSNIGTKTNSLNNSQIIFNYDKKTSLDINVTLNEKLNYSDKFVTNNKVISSDKNNPTEITYSFNDGEGKKHTAEYTIWYEFTDGSNGTKVSFHIDNAVVNTTLPDIVLNAEIQNTVTNNEQLTSKAEIRAEGANKFCSETNGNLSSCSVTIIKLGATAIYKTVDNSLIEQGGSMTYTIEYNNLSQNNIGEAYLYDLLPYNSDMRNTSYSGSYTIENISVNVGSNSAEIFTTNMTPVDVKSTMTSDWNNFETVFSKSVGSTTNGKAEINSSMNITGVGIKISGLNAYESAVLNITVKTNDNSGINTYCNNANVWVIGSNQTSALVSNTVKTETVGRNIEGFVWVDSNESGQFDENEYLVSDVLVTLMKQKADGTYSPCEYDVLGNEIEPITTDETGYYSFKNLSAGNYKILFSNANGYRGATEWQGTDTDAETNNKSVISDIDGYQYEIQYDENESYITLPTIYHMSNATYSAGGMNLGVLEYEKLLPEAGNDMNNYIFYFGCLAAVIALSFACLTNKKNEERNELKCQKRKLRKRIAQ